MENKNWCFSEVLERKSNQILFYWLHDLPRLREHITEYICHGISAWSCRTLCNSTVLVLAHISRLHPSNPHNSVLTAFYNMLKLLTP